MILDGINAFLECFRLMFQAVFSAPLYGSLTWGYFMVSFCVIAILISFFIARFK